MADMVEVGVVLTSFDQQDGEVWIRFRQSSCYCTACCSACFG